MNISICILKNATIRAASVAALKFCLEIGAGLQANTLIVHPINTTFPENPGVNELQKLQEQLAKSFTSLVDWADRLRLAVAVENLNDKYSTGILLYLMEHVPGLGLCLDTGHAQLASAWDIFLPQYAKRISALHLQDTHGKKDDHLIPGDGLIDFPTFIRILIASGYSGVWGCESVNADSYYSHKTPAEAAAKIYHRLQRLIQLAGENRK